MREDKKTIAVVGTGPTGMIAALLAAEKGFSVHLIGPAPNKKDGRTTALFEPSLEILEALHLRSNIEKQAESLRSIQIIDDTQRLIKAPTVLFHAREIGLDAFGCNIKNSDLNDLLEKAVMASSVQWHTDTVRALNTSSEYVEVVTMDKTLHVSAVIAADGRHSFCREAIGVASQNWSYNQSALVTVLSHDVPHHNVSVEFHTKTGPFTLVPMQGNQSSLVCVDTPLNAEKLSQMDASSLSFELEKRAHSLFGAFKIVSDVQVWPLSAFAVKEFAKKSVFLVGEAAHAFPPIGAQGLNLGLRDVRDAVECMSNTQNPGSLDAMQAFNQKRRLDVWSRTIGVDLLNRSLLSNALPFQLARSLVMHGASNISPLKQFLMQNGLGGLKPFSFSKSMSA
jgi:2-octaprenyl-6-methoxyphenol hydroxylase